MPAKSGSRAARVLVVGIGGLGSPVLQYLTAAGVGRIGAIDDDAVDETNLQRQTLFSTADVGRSKAAVAAERLRALNPGMRIDAIEGRFDASNARDLVRMYDVVVDCTDRFPTRYLINDACVLEKKPDVYGSIFRFDGQVSVFGLDDGPCYRCLYPEAPPEGTVPTCAEGGVLGALAGIVGAWQASETLKIVLRHRRTVARTPDADRNLKRARPRSPLRSRRRVRALRRSIRRFSMQPLADEAGDARQRFRRDRRDRSSTKR